MARGWEGQQGEKGTLFGPEGLWGSSSPFKSLFVERDHLRLARLWLTVLMYWLSFASPGTLSLIHTLKELQQQWRGGRGKGEQNVWAYIWPTLALFIQRVVTAEDQAPSPCSSSSLINLAVWFWPASHDVEGAGLSDHPPRGKALACPLGRHLLLFMPPLHSVTIFQLL